MFCEKCGAELKENVKFCTKCGTEIVKTTKESKKAKTVGKKNIWIAVGVCAILLCSSLGIVFAMKGKEAEPIQQEKLSEGIQDITNYVEQSQEPNQEQLQVLEEVLSLFEKDYESLWFGGKEVRILDYLEDDNVLVKLSVGNLLVQLVVPEDMHLEEYYLADKYIESYDGVTESCVTLVHNESRSAIYISSVKGEDSQSLYERSMEYIKNEENVMQFESILNGTGYILEEWMELPNGEELPGRVGVFYDEDIQIFCLVMLLSDNDAISEELVKALQQCAFRESDGTDWMYRCDAPANDIEARTNAMYEKYMEIFKDSTAYLNNNYEAVGSDYNYHSIYDLTNDGIPEIIYYGSPNWICIVGEKNAVNIPADSIYWSSEPNTFYATLFWQMTGSFTKYEIISNSEGCLSVEAKVADYLETDGERFWYQGTEITEEQYFRIVEELDSPYIPDADVYYEDTYKTKKGFSESVKKLTGEWIADVSMNSANKEIIKQQERFEKLIEKVLEEASENNNEEEEVIQENKVQVKKIVENLYEPGSYDGEYKYPGYRIEEYDEKGNLTYVETDYLSTYFENDYDEEGRISEQREYLPDGTLTYILYYDEYGSIVREGCPAEIDSEYMSTQKFISYDDLGRKVQEIVTWFYAGEPGTSYYDRTSTFTYNEQGLLETETVNYDSSYGYPTSVYRYEYDILLNEKKMYIAKGDEVERMLCSTRYNKYDDIIQEIYYDEVGNITREDNYSYDYTMDINGNVTKKKIYINDLLFAEIAIDYY